MARITDDGCSILITDGDAHITVPKRTAAVSSFGNQIRITWTEGEWGVDYRRVDSPSGAASANALRDLIADFLAVS